MHLNQDQINKLLDAEQTLGCHGMTHAYLPKLSDEELDYEIDQSQIELQQRFDVPVLFFSYPYGDPDERVLKRVSKRYQLAFRTDHGSFSDWRQAPYEIARISVVPGNAHCSELRKMIESTRQPKAPEYPIHAKMDFTI